MQRNLADNFGVLQNSELEYLLTKQTSYSIHRPKETSDDGI
jgi:hypothetical protein